MVLRVCRGVLTDVHDAEDAFQSTFLVLVKKARTLWVRESLAPWLYRVAYRAASCARSDAVRRRRQERWAAQRTTAVPTVSESGGDLDDERILHEELNRLPERYRMPIVLCDLKGLTHENAARCLHWPLGTVKSRQARGREKLRGRLTRRGLTPSAAMLGPVAPMETGSAAVPGGLVESTLTAVVYLTNSKDIPGIIPGIVVDLTRGVIRTMFVARLQFVLVTASLLGTISIGAGILNHAGAIDDQPGTLTQTGEPNPCCVGRNSF